MRTLRLPLSGLAFGASLLMAAPAAAQCPGTDDSFEDNDDCASAVAMANGTYTGLYTELDGSGDVDFYQITVPAGEILTATIDFIDANGDLDLRLWDLGCVTQLDGSFSVGDQEIVNFNNLTGSPVDVILEAYCWVGDATGCNTYDMTISTAPDPCTTSTDDAFEDNDDCATAWPLASGTYTGLYTEKVGGDTDFFQLTIPAGEQLTVTMDNAATNADTDMILWDVGCVNQLDIASTGLSTEVITYTNITGASLDVILDCHVWASAGNSCNVYDLDVATAPDPCLTTPDDAFEDNDDCATPTVLAGAGNYPGLRIDINDPDFYQVSVPAGQIMTATINFTHANADVDMALTDSGCVTFLDGSASVTDSETVSANNTSGGAMDMVIEVYVFSGSAGDCDDYTMDISFMPDPCATATDDGFEDNDDCFSATPGFQGLQSGLFVSKTDWDYYAYTIPDGGTITAFMFFSQSVADCDLILYDANDCGGGFGSNLVMSISVDDNEDLTWTNTTGAPMDVRLECNVWSGSAGDCANYDLDVTADVGTGNIGTNYCGPANVHSGGISAQIEAIGSTAVVDNDVTLHSFDLPAGQFAMYINSMNQGFITPPGSSGNLCVGPAGIGRYRFDIQNTGATGEAMLVLDLTDTPTPGGPVAIQAGETWNFQTWFRDQGGTSNFSDAIEILFN